MSDDQIFNRLIGQLAEATRHQHSWAFDFGRDCSFNVQCLWRLRNTDRILCTVDDDGQLFGLPAPVDAELEANEHLAGRTVMSCVGDPSTGDLQITFNGGLILELISCSGGYESWQAKIGDTTIVARGDGLIVFGGPK